jgi:hypothetical protein
MATAKKKELDPQEAQAALEKVWQEQSPKLDKSRPYGTVHGLGAPGRYEQDGNLFDAEGKLVK